MQTRVLGPTGRAVGAVGLGCMGMSWAYGADERDEDDSVAVIHRAIDLGVTLIDTADVYGPFANEELIGKALRGRRDEVMLATKCGLVVDDAATMSMHRAGNPEHVRRSIDASLRRLGTDVVDLYQLHRVDEAVPLEETWGAMAEVVAAGKARAIGLSEVTTDQASVAHAVHPVASIQSELSLWTRDALRDVVPWCAEHGAAFIPFAPLGRGFLTGTVTAGSFGADDFRASNPRFTPQAMAANAALVERIGTVAARHHATSAQVAIAWTLAQGQHVIPIPGTKKQHRLEENAGAADLRLDGKDIADLDSLPAPSGARY